MKPYRSTSLITDNPPLGPYSRTVPRVLWWSSGGWLFLMSEVPLYLDDLTARADVSWKFSYSSHRLEQVFLCRVILTKQVDNNKHLHGVSARHCKSHGRRYALCGVCPELFNFSNSIFPQASSCMCDAGYTYAADTNACSPCAPGLFKNSTSNFECLPCPVTKYTDVQGSVHCLRCQTNTSTSSVGQD